MAFRKLLNKIFSFKFVALILLSAIIVLLYNFETRISNIEKRFGGEEKLKCSEDAVQSLMNESVVRIIGSFSEGSGFPVFEHTIITNFHVIEGEPAPKVVFPDGSIETPIQILVDKQKDIASLKVEKKLKPLPMYGWFNRDSVAPNPIFGEPVFAAGYPYGSNIPGDTRIIKGSYNGKSYQKVLEMNVVEASIQLNEGMSGGPLVNSCGQVLGINTAGISGLSMFLDIEDVQRAYYNLGGEGIVQIEIDTSTPLGAVEAFYTYIKARNMEKAYELLSTERKSTINSFEEWIQGYKNTLHVNLIDYKVDENDENRVFIKMESQDWVDGEMVFKYFEGWWQVVPVLSEVEGKENESFKLNTSNIEEVLEPDLSWFYADES